MSTFLAIWPRPDNVRSHSDVFGKICVRFLASANVQHMYITNTGRYVHTYLRFGLLLARFRDVFRHWERVYFSQNNGLMK